MSLIVSIIIALIVVGLLLYAVSLLTMITDPIKQLIMALIVVLAALWIASRAGLF